MKSLFSNSFVQVSVFQDEGSGICLSFKMEGGKAALRGTFWND